MTRPFHAIHTHGFVRAAVCTPAVLPGDPAFNAAETLRMARQGDAEGCDLMLFPELGISAYAVDDLFLQDALLKRVEAEIAALAAATESLKPVLVVGAPVARAGRLYNCAIAISRGRILGVVPKSFLPNYREYYEKRWFAPGAGVTGLTVVLAG
ncbi:MAG: NAD(+) synthase, partial [Phenylobacterium sp.]|nr:NAD(+) synthase [Phenylobacterium sp.]